MPKRKEPELTPAEQIKRFKKAAKEAGVTQTEEEFERAFKKWLPQKEEGGRLMEGQIVQAVLIVGVLYLLPVQNGNSGGPVLDNAGNAVGIIYGKINSLQNVNFAIKAAVAFNFLQTRSVLFTSSTVATAILSPADLADRAKAFTVFIICSR